MEIILTIPFDPATFSPNKTRGRHWNTLRNLKQTIGNAAWVSWMQAGRPVATGRVVVNIVVHRSRVMDEDNTWAGCKPAFDGIFRGQITPDDSAKWVRLGRIHWRTGREQGKRPCVTLQIKSDDQGNQ